MEFVPTNLDTLTFFGADFESSFQNRPLLRFIASLAIAFSLFCYFNSCLDRYAKAFLLHAAIPRVNQFRLVNGIWRIFFSIWVIGIFLISLWYVKGKKSMDLISYATTSSCNSTSIITSRDITTEITFVIVPISYFLHQIYVFAASCLVEPPTLSFFSLATFVLSTNSGQCPHLCFQILLFLSLNVGSLEVARAIYALRSRCRGFKGPPANTLLKLLAVPAFILHILVWTIVTFYLFPTLYLSLPSIHGSGLPSPLATVYINIFLICFGYQLVFEYPMWSLLKHIVRRPSERRSSLPWKSLPMLVLLPYTSSLLPELRTIQINFLLDAVPTSAERRIIRKKIFSAGSQTSAPASQANTDLLSIVKCVKMLKRKMRNRYEQNTANDAAASDQENETENSQSCSNDEVYAASPGNEDVTDIYIPVPSVTNNVNRPRNIENDSTSEVNSEVVDSTEHEPQSIIESPQQEDETDLQSDVNQE